MSDSKPIESLTPDEINSAVAVEVMGWTVLERRKTSDDMPTVWVDGKGNRVFTFEPESNIAAAFDALEAGREKGLGGSIWWDDYGYNARVFLLDDPESNFHELLNVTKDRRARIAMECLLSAVRALKEKNG